MLIARFGCDAISSSFLISSVHWTRWINNSICLMFQLYLYKKITDLALCEAGMVWFYGNKNIAWIITEKFKCRCCTFVVRRCRGKWSASNGVRVGCRHRSGWMNGWSSLVWRFHRLIGRWWTRYNGMWLCLFLRPWPQDTIERFHQGIMSRFLHFTGTRAHCVAGPRTNYNGKWNLKTTLIRLNLSQGFNFEPFSRFLDCPWLR